MAEARRRSCRGERTPGQESVRSGRAIPAILNSPIPSKSPGHPASRSVTSVERACGDAAPHRLAVEHVLGMPTAGDDVQTIVEGYPWMERDDVLAGVEYATLPRGPGGRCPAVCPLRRMNVLLDSCVRGGALDDIVAAGHDVVWAGTW